MTTEELSLPQSLSRFSQQKTIDMNEDPHEDPGNKCFGSQASYYFFATVEESEHPIHQFGSF